MRIIGNRKTDTITASASGNALAAGARFSATIAALAPIAFVVKGVTRFATHEAANAADTDAIARAMAVLQRERKRIRPKL